jgi:predicted ABC-type transport system involved in lysophospholipase L1 biosynthesis ATPase subunit
MSELLELRDIEKGYRRGERRLLVLSALSLTVCAGEVVAILGSRYEGKTTLLKVVAGIEQPDGGAVFFDGTDLGTLGNAQRERLLSGPIAWVSREGSALELRVRDYVALPSLIARRRPPDAVLAAFRALDRVGISELADCCWHELSNWERVLVSLARGIVLRPRLLVIDDLLDGLGMSRTQQAAELLSTLVAEEGWAVLLSVSDAEAATIADRLYSFERGRLRLLSGQSCSAQVIELPVTPASRPRETRADG